MKLQADEIQSLKVYNEQILKLRQSDKNWESAKLEEKNIKDQEIIELTKKIQDMQKGENLFVKKLAQSE